MCARVILNHSCCGVESFDLLFAIIAKEFFAYHSSMWNFLEILLSNLCPRREVSSGRFCNVTSREQKNFVSKFRLIVITLYKCISMEDTTRIIYRYFFANRLCTMLSSSSIFTPVLLFFVKVTLFPLFSSGNAKNSNRRFNSRMKMEIQAKFPGENYESKVLSRYSTIQNGFLGVHISRNLLYFHSICPKFNNTNGSYLERYHIFRTSLSFCERIIFLLGGGGVLIVKIDRENDSTKGARSHLIFKVAPRMNERMKERKEREVEEEKRNLIFIESYPSSIVRNRNFHSNPYKSFNKAFKTMASSNQ